MLVSGESNTFCPMSERYAIKLLAVMFENFPLLLAADPLSEKRHSL